MSCQKRKADSEERERRDVSSAKRACFQDEKDSDETSTKKISKSTDSERQRILAILETEFDKELQAKEEEIIEVQQRILKTQRILQYLCYAAVSDFYSREKTITSVASTRQRRIHPAVKKLLSGKRPPGTPDTPQNVTTSSDSSSQSSTRLGSKNLCDQDDDILAQVCSPSQTENSSGKQKKTENISSEDKKVPRYIPPKPKPKPFPGSESKPIRGGQNKMKTILVVGNVSKWLPPDMRDDSASHKWMVYVRGPKGDPDISGFVSKVRFFLHPSYRPNDVVQVVCPPFHLSRRGWGEFPIRVQVHFSNSLNKPVDIIHNLKLDRTHCGLQTLGSETVAEVWIHRDTPERNVSSEERSNDAQLRIKEEASNSHNLISGMLIEETDSCREGPSSQEIKCEVSDNVTSKKPSGDLECDNSDPVKHENVSIAVTSQSSDSDFNQKSGLVCPPVNTSISSIKQEPSEEGLFNPGKLQSKSCKSAGALEKMVCSQELDVKPTASSNPPVSTGSQSAQSSPSKAVTQLVKCVDSSGKIHFLQVRPDMVPRIFKKGTTTIPATPPTTKDGVTMGNEFSAVSQKPQQTSSCPTVPQTSVPQVDQATPQKAEFQVLPHSSVRHVLPQASPPGLVSQPSVMQVISQASVVSSLPQSLTTQASAQASVFKTLPPGAVVQVSPQGSAVQSVTQPALTKGVLQTSLTQPVPHASAAQVSPQISGPQLLAQGNGTKVLRTSPQAQVQLSTVKSQLLPQVPSTIDPAKLVLTSPVKLKGMQSGISLPPGFRPVLRLVRPAGGTNVRPTLVSSNPASQQVIRLPAPTLSGGNRPLLVLKDGKLFMMKSALNAAGVSLNTLTSTTKAAVSCQDINKTDIVKASTTESLPSLSSSPSKSSILMSANTSSTTTCATHPPSVVRSVATENSNVMKSSVAVKSLNSVQQNTLSSRQDLAAKSKPPVTISPLTSILPTNQPVVSAQAAKDANKKNVVSGLNIPQTLGTLQANPPHKVTAKPGKSLLKPAVSLLKSNLGASRPSSSIASTSATVVNAQSLLRPLPPPVMTGGMEGLTVHKRIVLGRTLGSSCVTSTSQLALLYRERLRSVIRSCPKGPEEEMWRAVRWVVKNLPLVHPDAKHLEFKMLHPYCALDEKNFSSWNIGKQRACEWLRAKTVRSLLKDSGWDLKDLWTTREIVLWARFYGYTPGLPVVKNTQPKSSACGGSCENRLASVFKYGQISTVEEWLANKEKESSFYLQLGGVTRSSEDSDEEIDIISSITSPLKAVKVKQEPYCTESKDDLDEMPLESQFLPLASMVTESLNSIGLKLPSEEIVPGVRYPLAHRMLIQAVQSLAEDLTRRAFADAWSKDEILRQPDSIKISNVCGAICHRPEFDIFTCAGLGVASVDNS